MEIGRGQKITAPNLDPAFEGARQTLLSMGIAGNFQQLLASAFEVKESR